MDIASSLSQQIKPYLALSKPRLELISILVISIIQLRTVNLTRLAANFPGFAQTESCYRRIQNFFQKVSLDTVTLAKLIACLFGPEGPWKLSMDRTTWMLGRSKFNILYLAINYKGMAIPLLWVMLDKKGNSNTQERIDLLNLFLDIFPDQKVERLMADREFKGKKWLGYLVEYNWPFCLRIPVNTQIPNKHQNRLLPVRRIFTIKVGEHMVIRKPRKVWGHTVYLAAARSEKGLMALICQADPERAVQDYLERWQIETMFQSLKGRGFNMEETHLTKLERASKLLGILAIAFVWCYKTGEWVNEEKPIRTKKHGRKAKSLFRAGLDRLQRTLGHVDQWFSDALQFIALLFEPRLVLGS